MYVYTILRQDGTIETMTPVKKKWSYEQLRTQIGGLIEIIPKDYYPPLMTGTVFGHEEARFNSDNHTNPHLLTIRDPWGKQWDTVGDLVLEQTEKQYIKWRNANGVRGI